MTYARWLDLVEEEIVDVRVCGGARRPASLGRPRGPRYRWMNACGAVATEHRYSSEASRVLRYIASNCAAIRKLTRSMAGGREGDGRIRLNAESALSKLRHVAMRGRPFDDPTGGGCGGACGHAPQAVAAAALAEQGRDEALAEVQRVAIAHAEGI